MTKSNKSIPTHPPEVPTLSLQERTYKKDDFVKFYNMLAEMFPELNEQKEPCEFTKWYVEYIQKPK